LTFVTAITINLLELNNFNLNSEISKLNLFLIPLFQIAVTNMANTLSFDIFRDTMIIDKTNTAFIFITSQLFVSLNLLYLFVIGFLIDATKKEIFES